MRIGANAWLALYLLALPVAVALLELGVASALALAGLGLLARWALVGRQLVSAGQHPELVLETISASHFVEKVRWCLDRLGVEYRERANVGTLGVFFRARTVPRLHMRTGAVISSIGDSPAILRYLWGRYAATDAGAAEFLRPTPDALALEAQIDAYGVRLQQWIYHHVLPSRRLSLHVWGAHDRSLPLWQRLAIRVTFPVIRLLMRKAFRLRPGTHERVVQQVEAFLGEIEGRLADGRNYLLAGEQSTYVDYTLAALSGLWVWPDGYGGGRAAAVRPREQDLPAAMIAEMARWRAAYPLTSAFVERLYREERG